MRGYIGVGIAVLYLMIVVGLISAKVAGHLAWGWWIVLSPLWGPVVFAIVVVIAAIAIFGAAASSDENFFR